MNESLNESVGEWMRTWFGPLSAPEAWLHMPLSKQCFGDCWERLPLLVLCILKVQDWEQLLIYADGAGKDWFMVDSPFLWAQDKAFFFYLRLQMLSADSADLWYWTKATTTPNSTLSSNNSYDFQAMGLGGPKRAVKECMCRMVQQLPVRNCGCPGETQYKVSRLPGYFFFVCFALL